MADLAKSSQTIDFPKHLGKIILFLHLVFIVYLVVQINQSSEELALAKYNEFKNIAYVIYIGLFAIVGVLTIVKRLTKNSQPSGLLPTILHNITVSLVLTTFSFFLATLIIDLLKLLNLF